MTKKKTGLEHFTREQLEQFTLGLGHIIRYLDEDDEWHEFWTQDGEYFAYATLEGLQDLPDNRE